MPKGKYTAADVAPDAGTMPNAGPMGKYSAADVDSTPPPDDDSISRFFTGAADRVKSYLPTEGPSWDEALVGPGYAAVVKPMYKGYQAAAAEPAGSVGDVTKRVMASVPLVGPPAISIYDRAKSGDTAGAAGMGSVDALAMLMGGKGEGVAEAADHPIVRGAGRAVRDFDITKPFKSIGENVVGPAAEKFSQMRAARGKPTLQSPLDPSAGVKVAPGAPVEQPRIPSPAEDMVSSLEQGQSEIPVQSHSMQPTADMTSGGGGANYSADDLANMISKHNIPPAPGEVVGGAPKPNTTTVFHGTHTDALPGINQRGLEGATEFEGPWVTDSEARAQSYAEPRPHTGGVIIKANIPQEFLEGRHEPFGDDEANDFLLDDTIPRSMITDARHLERHGMPERMDDAAILQAMREDLDAHGRNALHEESTDFAARNKVGKSKTGKVGYGFNRKLPEAGQ